VRHVKRDSERVHWNFVPLVSVGPLRFGAGHEELVDALNGVTRTQAYKTGAPVRGSKRDSAISASSFITAINSCSAWPSTDEAGRR
jgi:hypothetical protein